MNTLYIHTYKYIYVCVCVSICLYGGETEDYGKYNNMPKIINFVFNCLFPSDLSCEGAKNVTSCEADVSIT